MGSSWWTIVVSCFLRKEQDEVKAEAENWRRSGYIGPPNTKRAASNDEEIGARSSAAGNCNKKNTERRDKRALYEPVIRHRRRRWLSLSPYFFSFWLSGQRNLRAAQLLKKPNCWRAQFYLGSGAIRWGPKTKKNPMLQKNEGERGRRRGALELLRERQNESWRRAPPADRS